MAAGLGFKTFATGDVLSAADVNGYLMQGVLVFASAAARDAAITSPQEGQFAYLKDTNVTTYYTGSAWTNLDTTGMVNPMTTTGDTIYSSSGSTPARLGIGTTGQVLTVAGGIPSWAAASSGSMTLLSTTTLSGTSTVVTSIDQTYLDLYILVTGVTNDVANGSFFWRPNNTANLGTYRYPNGDTTVAASFGGDIIFESGALLYASSGGNNAAAITIQNYASTTTRKPFSQTCTFAESGGTDAVGSYALGGLKTNSAITSIGFHKAGGGSFTAGTVKIYGVK